MLKAFTVTITPELKAFDKHAKNYVSHGERSFLDFGGFKEAVADLQAQAEPAEGERALLLESEWSMESLVEALESAEDAIRSIPSTVDNDARLLIKIELLTPNP